MLLFLRSIFLKRFKYFLFFFCIVSTSAQSETYEWKGTCVLDRTVDSYDLTTWATAKSRAMADFIPLKFNNNLLSLGIDDAQHNYLFINTTGIKEANNFTILQYENSEINSIIVLYGNNGLSNSIILYSKGAPPYFIGSCNFSKSNAK